MTCPNCQTNLNEQAPFCVACGLIFIATTTAATTVAAPPNATNADPLLGRVLDGKYELLARLGQGGMGTVYRARRVHIGDEVAVKVLHQQYSTTDDVLARFRCEAKTAASLRHANVVTIYDYNETDALAYLVMEFVPGQSLGQLLKNNNRLPLAPAITLLRHICAGVGAAHRRGIVHRDLKPDNIIVLPPTNEGESETVKVVDFGIAKLRDLAATQALTETGMIIGTPFYMSPEQCRGDELDASSDVYSLGVLFYEMIAGMRPFTAPAPTGVIAKHLTQAPPPLHPTLRIPPSVEATLMRALAKDPSARPADALAFARALESALQQTMANTPLPHSAKLAKPARSHFLRNALLVVVALFCLLAGGAGLLLYHFAFSQPRASQPPVASPTPARIVTSTKPTATPTSKATATLAPRPTPAHVTARHQPPPPPLGLVKEREHARLASDTMTVTLPVPKPTARRAAKQDNAEQMPPEIRRVMEQLLKNGIPTRDAEGKVKTVYVTRPLN